ncbi:tyrosine-protein phosphatase [Limosilactobacillus caecicola]|uniref:tyrosine-protein phosphatase n=1 Tax=Limosilactobacillus caecicola TaxID=2941332 RepID=UPI00203E2418|nr:tyrosine-protein phosphatase [Limosilactobacillus caecicola]
MVHQRIIPIFHTNNFRDLGGYATATGQTVQWGRIFRADKLDRLSKDDQAELVKLAIGVDIDLRSAEETKSSPDRLPEQVQYLFNPVFKRDVTDSSKNVSNLAHNLQSEAGAGRQHMQEVYHDMMTSDAAAHAFREIFEQLLTVDDQQGVLFHCTAGKDRTGMSAYLILRAFGVSPAVAKKDYLLTNTALKNFLRGQQATLRSAGKPATLIDNYTALWTADPSYLAAALKVLQAEYGDVNGYLTTALQLSPQDLQDLKAKYLIN